MWQKTGEIRGRIIWESADIRFYGFKKLLDLKHLLIQERCISDRTDMVHMIINSTVAIK